MWPQKLSIRLLGLLFIPVFLVSCGAPAPSSPTPVIPTLSSVSTPTQILPTPTLVSTATQILQTLTPTLPPEKPLYATNGKYQVGFLDPITLPVSEIDPVYTSPLLLYVYYPELNNKPDTAHGPYPLVIFSPGSGGTGKDYELLLKPIVSHGFVIITSNSRGETDTLWRGAAARPLDLQSIIDFADEATAPGGQLDGLIDTRKIGIMGHSSGGWTALIGGGAQMDLGWCTAHPDIVAKNPMNDCAQFLPYQQEIAALLGLKSAPTGIWPAMNDPRVAAVIAISPDGDIFGTDYEGVSVLKVPTLIMAGADDPYNVPEITSYPIYEHLGSQKKTLVVFEHGDHGLSWETYSDMIQHSIVAFLLAELKGDSSAANTLLPENVTYPGVKITTTVNGTP